MEIEHTPLSVHINNGIIGKKPNSKLRLVYSVQSKLRSRQSKHTCTVCKKGGIIHTISSTTAMSGIRTHNISSDGH